MAGIIRASKQGLKHLLGTCMPSAKSNAAKIQVPILEYDENLCMYFKKYEYYYAHDPHKLCKTGDTVLVKQLPENLTRLISHEVVDVVFPLGDVTDPISGKKVVVSKFRDDIKEANKLYGESENAFDYDKALPRGSLEDKRDFTHKPAYKKYYEDPNDPQPYAV